MMGYVKAGNVVEDVETPLHARATVIREPESGRRFAFVCAEICFITLAIKQGVMDLLAARHPELGLREEDVLLTATHTHSAPGGYSHYFFYNVSIPGFCPEVWQRIIEGIVEAIAAADRQATPGRVRLAAGEIPSEREVAFNRSLAAYNANPEVQPKLSHDQRHLAVDREMTVLRLEREDGAPLGLISWFATHATNVHNDNRRISADNKGYASRQVEAHFGGEFVATFAQGPAGDVSPNFQRFPGLPFPRGKFRDDFESARYNGAIQAETALALFEGAQQALPPVLDAALMYVDFADVEVPAAFADGQVRHTAPAAIGVPMLKGTAEGPGIPEALAVVVHALAAAYKARLAVTAHFGPEGEREAVRRMLERHGNKALVVEMGAGRILGNTDCVKVLPTAIDPVLGHIKEHHLAGTIGEEPWTPHVLPLQLVIVGRVAIAATPAEFSTMAGRRLKATILEALAPRGIERVVVTGYANGYSGYVTTPEEYDVQLYEGASTHFGKWTLGAYRARFHALALELLKPPAERNTETGLRPHAFDPAALEKRTFTPAR